MDVSIIGRDPLEAFQELKQRRQVECLNHFRMSNIFKECINNLPRML